MDQFTISGNIHIIGTVFLTAIAEGGPWASDCVWHKKNENDGGGPLASQSRSPGRESTQRLCTFFSRISLAKYIYTDGKFNDFVLFLRKNGINLLTISINFQKYILKYACFNNGIKMLNWIYLKFDKKKYFL